MTMNFHTVIYAAITAINLVRIGNIDYRLHMNTSVFPSVNFLCDVY